MAVRTVRVGPDSIHETLDGQRIGVLSVQGQIEALARMATVCDVCGGNFEALYGRFRTGREGEMVTTEVILNWRDRADAKAQAEERVRFEDLTGAAIFGDEQSAPDDDFAREDGIELVAANGAVDPSAL